MAGVAGYAQHRPHSVAVAVPIAAGIYELTPFTRECRWGWRSDVRAGFDRGLYCVGSSSGLTAMFVALGLMSVAWMSVVAVLVFVQKLSPPKASIDVSLAGLPQASRCAAGEPRRKSSSRAMDFQPPTHLYRQSGELHPRTTGMRGAR